MRRLSPLDIQIVHERTKGGTVIKNPLRYGLKVSLLVDHLVTVGRNQNQGIWIGLTDTPKAVRYNASLREPLSQARTECFAESFDNRPRGSPDKKPFKKVQPGAEGVQRVENLVRDRMGWRLEIWCL